MLVKDANKKRKAYGWMISQIMAEKERAALDRRRRIEYEQPALKVTYEQYLKLYNLHIKPLMPAVNRYFSHINELKKIEHFLDSQVAYANEQTQIQKLPYAGKSAVGHRAKQKALDEQQASEVMTKLKALDPTMFAQLLKQVGGK